MDAKGCVPVYKVHIVSDRSQVEHTCNVVFFCWRGLGPPVWMGWCHVVRFWLLREPTLGGLVGFNNSFARNDMLELVTCLKHENMITLRKKIQLMENGSLILFYWCYPYSGYYCILSASFDFGGIHWLYCVAFQNFVFFTEIYRSQVTFLVIK